MTIDYFFILLSDYVYKRKSRPPKSDVNWEELIKVAKFHNLSGIVYFQCKKFIPNEYRETMEKSCATTLFNYANRLKEEKTVLLKLKETGVSCFIIKGSVVAAFYPIPALRTMGDTDIVVDDADKTHDVLISSGYECKTKCAVYVKNGFLYEVHDHITHVNEINSTELVKFFNDYWDYVKDGELDCNFHLLFLILHLRSHFYGSGVGIRQFLDVAMVTQYCENLDWSWIEQKLKEFALWTFAQKIFDLNRRWFGVTPPIIFSPVDDAFYREATKDLYLGGVFGTEGNTARRMAAHGYGSAIRLRGMVFVPYKDMIRMPQYAFLIGRPYLLPIAWIYRGWLKVTKLGAKNTGKIIQTTVVSKNTVNEQKEYIEKWNQ